MVDTLVQHTGTAADRVAALDSDDLLPNATRRLAEFSSELSFESLPAELVTYAKDLILDNLGVALFGVRTPWGRLITDMALEEGAKPASTVFGTSLQTSPALAALVNATGGHGFEFDEIHREAGYHPGSIIIPVIMALAESENGKTGRDLIVSTIAGYEVGARVGNAATTALFYRGFHPQGTTGVFSGAAAAARILEMDAEKTHHAFGIAGTQAAGLMAAQEGAMVKRMHAGRAAQSGVYGALLARRGFTGITNVLEASFGGFLSTISGEPNATALLDGLGSKWETLVVGYKPYATVASIHTALDGLKTIMQENALEHSDIARIDVGCSKVTYHHCAWAYKPAGVTAAQMNLFFGLGAIAVDGEASINQFTDARLTDPDILSVIDRTHAYISEDIEKKGREARHASHIKVTTTDGRVFERDERHRKGARENPPEAGAIEAKFRLLANTMLPRESVDQLVDFVMTLEEKQDLTPLFDLLRV